MKAVLWGYKYADMGQTWWKPMNWLAAALQVNGVEVLLHDKFKCQGLENHTRYDHRLHNSIDICIYNHADISHLRGNILQAKQNWFFKPTVPTVCHATLDPLGYGPYSSITYEKPPYENMDAGEVKEFFRTKVRGWIEERATKWGSRFKASIEDIPFDDYWLVLGQCGGDEVVSRHDFGHYFPKLKQIITELAGVDERPVVVKLHPYTDGEGATDTKYAQQLKKQYEAINPKVKVYIGKSNVHSFIEKARCVVLANSGAGIEVMMHHKPMITWGFPEYHWVTYDLRHLADMGRAAKLDWFNPVNQDKFLYWYLEKYCFYDQGTANRRVAEMLKN